MAARAPTSASSRHGRGGYHEHQRNTLPGSQVESPQGRLLKIKHDHHEMGFLSARISSDFGSGWVVRVESPDDVDEYLTHLHQGRSMGLSLVTRDGACYRGEACVSSVSIDGEFATLVVLAGVGPLHSD
jgi:hypothetical protein